MSGNGQVMISGQQPVRTGAQGQQVRVASPAGTQMRLMSIPTGALSQGTRIIVPDQSSLVMAASIPQSVPGKMLYHVLPSGCLLHGKVICAICLGHSLFVSHLFWLYGGYWLISTWSMHPVSLVVWI